MIRFKAILYRVIKELLRDKRTLALMFLAPLLVLTLMHVIFTSTDDPQLTIGLDDTVPSSIATAFKQDKVTVQTYTHAQDGKKMITTHHLDAFLTLKEDTFYLTYSNEDPSVTAQTTALFSNILTEHTLEAMGAELKKLALETKTQPSIESYKIDKSYVYGNQNSTFFDKIFPILIGFFVFFFVFLISGIALLKERTSGTLERLLATPIKRSELIFGYLVGYGLFAIIQTLLIVFFSIYLLKVDVAGNIGFVILINIILSLVALSMGIFVSTFANSEFQMIQFIPLIVIPQVFFSGIIPLDSMADWVRNLSYLFPLSYAGNALTAVMIKGQGFSAIWQSLCILIGFVLLFTCLNIVGLKRYRKV